MELFCKAQADSRKGAEMGTGLLKSRLAKHWRIEASRVVGDRRHLPTLLTLDELVRLAERSKPLFVRYSQGPDEDCDPSPI